MHSPALFDSVCLILYFASLKAPSNLYFSAPIVFTSSQSSSCSLLAAAADVTSLISRTASIFPLSFCLPFLPSDLAASSQMLPGLIGGFIIGNCLPNFVSRFVQAPSTERTKGHEHYYYWTKHEFSLTRFSDRLRSKLDNARADLRTNQ